MTKKYTYCNVLVDGLNKPYLYIYDGDINDIEVGTNVIVPIGVDEGYTPGTITGINVYSEEEVPKPVEETRLIFDIDEYVNGSSSGESHE